MEIWRSVRKSTKYEVSDKGRVRNAKTCKILKTSDSRGYEKVNLHYDGIQHSEKVHRLVAEAFIPIQNDKNVVNHIDGNKHNNNVENLEWCTSSENNKHAFLNGLNHRSDKSGVQKRKVKIIETDCIFESVSDCSRFLNVAPSHIFACLSGKRNSCHGYTFEYID